MPRTTINIDDAVLRRLRERQRVEAKTLGELVSELLARALDESAAFGHAGLEWTSAPMAARVDLEDQAAVGRALDDAGMNFTFDTDVLLENGVRTIWTRDRDFRRFSDIEARDPFV